MRGYLRSAAHPCWEWVKRRTNFKSVNTETWRCLHCLTQVECLSYMGRYQEEERDYNRDLRKPCFCIGRVDQIISAESETEVPEEDIQVIIQQLRDENDRLREREFNHYPLLILELETERDEARKELEQVKLGLSTDAECNN